MQGVILAGGLGTRLMPRTESIPKVMLSVNGQPFIVHLLRLLKQNGIHEIVLCIGYLGEQVKEYLGNGSKWGLKIAYSEEKGQLLGTGGALKQACSLLNEHFLVVNGDTYLPILYNEVEESFLRRDKKALMVVYDNGEDTGVKNNVALNGDLMVLRHDKEKPDPELKYVEAGVLALAREVLDIIPGDCSVSLEEGLYPALIKQRNLEAFATRQRFFDIGTSEHLRVFESFLRENQQ